MFQRLFVSALAAAILCSGTRADPAKPLLGFKLESVDREIELERSFDAQLDKGNLRNWLKEFSSRPHQVGSKAGKENAQRIAEMFRGWGYRTRIEVFNVLFPTPRLREVEMLEPVRFKAVLAEPALKEDSTSAITDELLPPYNAYSPDGDVTAPVVYVNYGIPTDYDILEQRGIDVRGKIVLARYGGSWRGIKPKVAAEHGAIGCLIYSDPRDDGYFQGDVYPKGPWRNPNGAQRGSVADLPLYAGDPLTPFVGATTEAHRLARSEALTLAKIPVLPLSYADATPILQQLQGPVAPEEWRGALPLTYHLGPGPAKVRLHVEFNWDMVPAFDVIAEMAGTEFPDEWIIRGNHHDAWVFGANDPLSGMVSLLEEARGLSVLAQSGWKPKRTIVFTVWDAEEPGLLGSTEWVETHASELLQHAALYINSDNTGRGFLRAGGSHSLEALVRGVAADVRDPETGISVGDRRREQLILSGTPEQKKEMREGKPLKIGALGSGSDYTPFLQHLGIASLDLRYEGEDGGGAYHSTYDSFDHFSRFGDPDFSYTLVLAKTAGRVVLRAANAELLPFSFGECADTYAAYLQDIMRQLDAMRAETDDANRLIHQHVFRHVMDPTQRFVIPEERKPVPFLNFAPLQNAIEHLRHAALHYQSAAAKSAADNNGASPAETVDLQLIRTERALTPVPGLPRRPWYRHLVYAPGFYTGYGVKTLPGVREAVEQRDWEEAGRQIQFAADALHEFAKRIDSAAAEFQ